VKKIIKKIELYIEIGIKDVGWNYSAFFERFKFDFLMVYFKNFGLTPTGPLYITKI